MNPKQNILLKSIWSGVLGITAEIITALVFIFAGLAVCLIWWSFFK